MDFKLDENLPRLLDEQLARLGHDVMNCEDEGLLGAEDPQVAAHANDESRVLVTLDLDFSDIRAYPPGSHPGIMVLRIARQDANSCATAMLTALLQMQENDIIGNTVIVEETRVRIRRPNDA